MARDSGKSRDLILARRKFFIASAVAGAALGACDSPRACLNIAEPQPSTPVTTLPEPQPTTAPVQPTEVPQPTDTAPRPCLEIVAPEPSVQPTATQPSGTQTTTKPPPPPPRVCLRMKPPPGN